jgi:hypothetical protein
MKIVRLFLSDKRFSPGLAPKMRGCIASKYPDEVMLHNHLSDNKYVYNYPKVQYKVIDSVPLIIGIDEGVPVLLNVIMNLDDLQIENKNIDIMEKKIEISNEDFGDTEKPLLYRFVSPWMGLNQKNHRLYLEEDAKGRKILLQKNIVNNIISLSKSLGYTVRNNLQAVFNEESLEVNFKDKKILCFRGVFAVNFQIPDYIGIGKSVSRGFGTVKKIRQTKEDIK